MARLAPWVNKGWNLFPTSCVLLHSSNGPGPFGLFLRIPPGFIPLEKS
jgi:hypothetical protein